MIDFLSIKDHFINLDKFDPERLYGSIPIIAKHQLLNLQDSGVALNAVSDASNISSDVCLCVTLMNWTNVDFIDNYKLKMYFFDDLDLWKIKNSAGYSDFVKKFDYFLTPKLDTCYELVSHGFKSIYVPFTIHAPSMEQDVKVGDYIVLDIFSNKSADYIYKNSIRRAEAFIEYFLSHNPNGLTLYIPYGCDQDFISRYRSESIVFLDKQPYLKFMNTIGGAKAFVSSVASSYEFTPQEARFFGVPTAAIENCLVREHQFVSAYSSINSIEDYIFFYDAIGKTSRADVKNDYLDRFPHDSLYRAIRSII